MLCYLENIIYCSAYVPPLTTIANCFSFSLRANKKKAATPSSDSDQDESLQRLEDEKQELQAKLSDLAPSYGLVHPVSVVCFVACYVY